MDTAVETYANLFVALAHETGSIHDRSDAGAVFAK